MVVHLDRALVLNKYQMWRKVKCLAKNRNSTIEVDLDPNDSITSRHLSPRMLSSKSFLPFPIYFSHFSWVHEAKWHYSFQDISWSKKYFFGSEEKYQRKENYEKESNPGFLRTWYECGKSFTNPKEKNYSASKAHFKTGLFGSN